ncbi:hypothetical protein ACLIA0_06165 [Bacillaceae bacterium W0354]
MDSKEVLIKWNTEGNLSVIYRVENILLFYTKENDPLFNKGEKVSLETVEKSKPYKATHYSENNIPSDAVISLTFTWQSDGAQMEKNAH